MSPHDLSSTAGKPGALCPRLSTASRKSTLNLLALACAIGTLGSNALTGVPQPAGKSNAASPGEVTSQKSWRSELYPDDWTPPDGERYREDAFIQDYSYAGYARGEKPIPTLADATTLNVLEYGADPSGKTDSTSAIQQAIDTASSIKGGAIVYLPAGLYKISRQSENSRSVLRIRQSNIVLRGDGPQETRLLNTSTEMRGAQIIYIGGGKDAAWSVEESPVSAISTDLSGPTTIIPLDDVSGFTVGDTVIVRADPTPEWVKEHKEEGWLGYESKLGSISYLRRIEYVNTDTNEITIDIPTRYALKVRDHARVYRKTRQLHDVGLENFGIANVEHPGQDGWGVLDFAAPDSAYTKRLIEGYNLDDDFAQRRKSAYDVHFSFAIAMVNVIDSWIVNVASFLPEGNARGSHLLSNGIRLKECLNVSIIDCSMRHTLYGGGGGNGYMFRLDNSNECLIQDSHAEAARHGYSISGMGSSGNVLYRCFDKDTATQAAPPGVTTGRGSDNHMWFSHSNLYDNCVADNSWFEARDRYYEKMSQPKHNTTSTQTVFWNTTGLSNSYHDFVIWSVQGDNGYVIGTQGPVDTVSTAPQYAERKYVSDPVDHVEGVGQGATLEPASLFMDQRTRRLKQ